MGRRLGLALAVVACVFAVATGVAGGTLAGDTLDVLTARFGAPGANLGSSREWYSPTSGVFRVERTQGGRRSVAVYNGTWLSARTGDVMTRVTGSATFVRIEAGLSRSIFSAPASYVSEAYRKHEHTAFLTITPRSSGAILDAVMHYPLDSGGVANIPIHVARTGHVVASARLLAPVGGRLVGELKQSPAGSHPHFGEGAYWFGPTLWKAHAETTVENWGTDASSWPVTASFRNVGARRQAHYATIYRLPLSAIRGLPFHPSATPFPGLGVQQPPDIRVECMPSDPRGLPGVSAGTVGTPVTLTNGAHAKLFVNEYTQGRYSGVWADIVVGKTVCFTQGLIPATTLRLLAKTLRPA